jgi:hypothetical protein
MKPACNHASRFHAGIIPSLCHKHFWAQKTFAPQAGQMKKWRVFLTGERPNGINNGALEDGAELLVDIAVAVLLGSVASDLKSPFRFNAHMGSCLDQSLDLPPLGIFRQRRYII